MTTYYVYRYFDPSRNEYFYVGKGTGPRAGHHKYRKDKHPMTHRLQYLKRLGIEPLIDYIVKDVDEEFALFVEQEAIAKYGRRDLGLGPLLNLTDGGDGCTGFKHTTETKEQIRITLKKTLSNQPPRIASAESIEKGLATRAARALAGLHKKPGIKPGTKNPNMGNAQRGKPWSEARRLAQKEKLNVPNN